MANAFEADYWNEKHRADEYEKALLHWRREYDVLFQENNVLHSEVKRLLAEYTKLHDALLDGMASQIAERYVEKWRSAGGYTQW